MRVGGFGLNGCPYARTHYVVSDLLLPVDRMRLPEPSKTPGDWCLGQQAQYYEELTQV